MDYEAIGRRIAKQRKKKQLTQATFSEKLGISEGYVSRLECGSAKASLQRLETIAKILNIDIGLLVSDRVILPGIKLNRDVCELINDWTPSEIEMLIAHLECANNVRNKHRKQ